MLATSLLLLAPSVGAERLCAVCEQDVGGRYLELHGQSYCSKSCLRVTLPTCHVCASPVEQGMRMGERVYCQPHADAVACGACGHPAVDQRRLADGRILCAECAHRAVETRAEALPFYLLVARSIEAITGRELGRLPRLELVSQPELLERGKGRLSEASLGLYRTDRWVSTVDDRQVGQPELRNPRISMLTHLREERFEAAVAHELAHHLLALHFLDAEEQGPDWLREGVAEYVAALTCRRAGRVALAEEMREKGPPYGNGLRWLEERFGLDGWRDLEDWLARVDARRLPARPQ